NITVGNSKSSNGFINVDGAGAALTGFTGGGSHWLIGNQGHGNLEIRGGGHVSDCASDVAFQSGSTGTAYVAGVGSVWTSAVTLGAAGGQGVLILQSGGTVNGNVTVYANAKAGCNGGTGTINGNLTNGGIAYAGNNTGAGLLEVNGNYIQNAGRTLQISISG